MSLAGGGGAEKRREEEETAVDMQSSVPSRYPGRGGAAIAGHHRSFSTTSTHASRFTTHDSRIQGVRLTHRTSRYATMAPLPPKAKVPFEALTKKQQKKVLKGQARRKAVDQAKEQKKYDKTMGESEKDVQKRHRRAIWAVRA